MQIAFYFAFALTACCGLVMLALPALLRPTREAERLLTLVQSSRADRRTISRHERVAARFLATVGRVRGLLGLTGDTRVLRRLGDAGIRHRAANDLFFSVQCVGTIGGAGLGALAPFHPFFCASIGAAVGFIAPSIWLTSRGKRRRDRIRRSIPDSVDLLVICVDAGLGLDQALLRVGEELQLSHPEINEEFGRINLEQRAGVPRLDAWKNLAERTKIEEFAAFVTMLAQTDRFGTPIVKALSTFAADLRLKRRQHAEEQAAKTKIKIIFPLVFFIFPAIFIVLLAPALLSILDGMKSMAK